MTPSSGDTAWVLTSAALVLLMTPGLALFYGGMVRAKSVLNMMMMSFGALGLISVLWVLYGYSLAFGDDAGGGSSATSTSSASRACSTPHRSAASPASPPASRPWRSSPSRPCSRSSRSP